MRIKYKLAILTFLLTSIAILVISHTIDSPFLVAVSLIIIPSLITKLSPIKFIPGTIKFKKSPLCIRVISTTAILYLVAAHFLNRKTEIPQHPVVFLSLLFYTAIPEEIFFRGYLLELLKDEGESFISRGNVLTSLAFALLHVAMYKNIYMLKVFFPSLIFGYLYEKTENLLCPVLCHWIFDIIYLVKPL